MGSRLLLGRRCVARPGPREEGTKYRPGRKGNEGEERVKFAFLFEESTKLTSA